MAHHSGHRPNVYEMKVTGFRAEEACYELLLNSSPCVAPEADVYPVAFFCTSRMHSMDVCVGTARPVSVELQLLQCAPAFDILGAGGRSVHKMWLSAASANGYTDGRGGCRNDDAVRADS